MLLDLHMPDVDGFEVIRRLRERERSSGSRLPVIACTARSRKEEEVRCLAAGMTTSSPSRSAALPCGARSITSPPARQRAMTAIR